MNDMELKKMTEDEKKIINDLYNDKNIQDFISDFKNFNLKYIAAMNETVTKIKILNEDFKTKYKHSPIDHIESRIKTVESLVNKMIKNQVPFDLNNLENNIFDIAGVRVVCSFISDIFTIVDMIEKNEDITVLRTKDYINNPKKSGYRSYHMILKVPIYLTTGREEVIVELQIRTMAMDFWASLEHQIKYKYDGVIPDEVKEELVECANSIYETDEKMMKLNKRVQQINRDK